MNKLNRKRVNRCQRFSRILAIFPFVRCIILNGSLAQGKSKESSDIDLLIITKTGRIFTARFFINSVVAVFGLKRSKDEKKNHSGKFCFNYFLTEDYLRIPTGRGEQMDKYCAENYSQSVYMAGEAELFNQFMVANQSLFDKYGYETRTIQKMPKYRPAIIQRMIESLFLGQFGDWLERKVKSWQVRKIKSDKRTEMYPELIVCSDRELRFHPPKTSR